MAAGKSKPRKSYRNWWIIWSVVLQNQQSRLRGWSIWIRKKKLSTKLIILIPVFILGIFSIISNVMSVSNIRNVNRSAVQISEVSLKNVFGSGRNPENRRRTSIIWVCPISSRWIWIPWSSWWKKSAVRKMHWRKIWKVTRYTWHGYQKNTMISKKLRRNKSIKWCQCYGIFRSGGKVKMPMNLPMEKSASVCRCHWVGISIKKL